MGLLITILLGALVGWLASKVMNTDAEQGALLNIVVGIVGAFLGNVLVAPLLGVRAELGLTLPGLLVAFVGACLLLAIVNLFTRRRVR